MIYPWHRTSWRQLAGTWNSLPHALLLHGMQYTGKTAFARHLAQALLCETLPDSREPCGECPSCRLFAQNSHPDFYELTPEIPEGETAGRRLLQIKIDAVRSVLDDVRLTAVRGGRRVVLVHPAESMNVQAANALLKMLEEPPESVVFLLVSHAPDRLLPTIKSRCRQFVPAVPSRTEAAAWLHAERPETGAQADGLLAFYGGAPLFEYRPEYDALYDSLCAVLAAPRLLNILDFAAEYDRHKLPLEDLLDRLSKWLADIALAHQNRPACYYPAHAADTAAAARETKPATLFALYDAINRLMPYGRHTLSVKMQAEYLLTEYLNFRLGR